MMNIFDLEMQMRENGRNIERTALRPWTAQLRLPMLDLALGTAAVGALSAMF
ncbi:hypothetical protein N0M98_00680 [Paenibacillus doosanensis]|uniref:Uncharacterized protein n=1 Tax=Paenibacillus konkukensis TaxID=2020716 RepID=A0ABY4RXA5_9BACL|nr:MULTISPECIES: hypothetical protein [Paenibacillus]MCS7458638.1 hypothetical protein [Paenibacillus doosanensis]UQZ86838.1 hypothetical protein SK3146_06131 [Paenibacillus konkukensis]